MKKTIITIVVLIIIAAGIYFFVKNKSNDDVVKDDTDTATTTDDTNDTDTATTTDDQNAPESVIGTSVEDRDIKAYHFGTGEKEILFVGGIHGGYEWNTSLVAFELIDYLKENPDAVPADLKVTVIPVLNPDGLNKVVGTDGRFEASDVATDQKIIVEGRFNGNNVDLNRNFDCDWKASAVWQNKTVSGGTSAFSEPESMAIRDYVQDNNPVAVIVWYSSAGGVYASSCDGKNVSAETDIITKAFAKASGYPAHTDFNSYAINGDMTNWLAKEGVPAISVLLTDHTNTEWAKNKKGVEAILEFYSK